MQSRPAPRNLTQTPRFINFTLQVTGFTYTPPQWMLVADHSTRAAPLSIQAAEDIVLLVIREDGTTVL
jgi:hypothetical protein